MSNSTQSPTTVTNIGVAMFSVADQDAALAFYTEKLGYEVRADVRFGEGNAMRWLEVAPPGSTARLALNPPMGGRARWQLDRRRDRRPRQRARAPEVDRRRRRRRRRPWAPRTSPRMFSLRDPDGNNIWIVETPAS